jgi:hypothetical protein
MSDKKLPQPGEWWEYDDENARAFIHLCGIDGDVVVEWSDDRGNYFLEDTFDNMDHLPDCTGWDWVPETWPKYYDTLDGPTTSVAYVRRESSGSKTIVQKDGTEVPGFGWEALDDQRAELTEAEAKARLTVPVLKCYDCGEPVLAGHEDVCPMAWVTQDRVPARPGIDERAYKYESDASVLNHWADAANIDWPEMPRHGTVRGPATVHLRCRRKDLPPAPVKTKIPLRVFVSKHVKNGSWWPPLFVSIDESGLEGTNYTEVHGLNLYIEDPSASGSGDAAEEASASG